MLKYLIEHRPETRKLSAWGERRLSFEPTGKAKKYRDELSLALSSMEALPSETLFARYYCLDKSFFDVENVLFYNVGVGAFQKAAQYGVRFQRFTYLPPSPNPAFHYFREYTFERNLDPLIDTNYPHLTMRFTLPKLNTDMKPHQVWWQIKKGSVAGDLPEDWDKNPYKLSITIFTSKPNRNWASYVKPLIDGVTSSLNYQPQSVDTLRVAKLIASALNVKYEEVLSYLSIDNSGRSTRKDNLVAPYRNFIKWNPTDDLCFGAELIPILVSDNRITAQVTLQFSK